MLLTRSLVMNISLYRAKIRGPSVINVNVLIENLSVSNPSNISIFYISRSKSFTFRTSPRRRISTISHKINFLLLHLLPYINVFIERKCLHVAPAGYRSNQEHHDPTLTTFTPRHTSRVKEKITLRDQHTNGALP